jgi:hypothetical protein
VRQTIEPLLGSGIRGAGGLRLERLSGLVSRVKKNLCTCRDLALALFGHQAMKQILPGIGPAFVVARFSRRLGGAIPVDTG